MDQWDREQEFWDSRVESLDDCLKRVRAPPEPNTARAIELLAPLEGAHVLDVGCGTGVLSAWLARAGAKVTGIDISPAQVARASELHQALGLDSRFLAGAISEVELGDSGFDRLAGRYVLHHLDPPSVAGVLAALLRPGGKAVFVETMGLNPILRLARRRLAGRLGVPRYGTEDERPLTSDDLSALSRAFGGLRLEVAEMRFFRILDRQVLHFRFGPLSKLLGSADDVLMFFGLARWSFHQIVVLESQDPVGGSSHGRRAAFGDERGGQGA
jgi:SAM-dependent methyltransferase